MSCTAPYAGNSAGSTWAVIPIKKLYAAKQRLRTCLSPLLRRRLVESMLSDVLLAVAATPDLAGYVVVTADTNVKTIARELGAELIVTRSESGQSAALYEAVKVLGSAGIKQIVTLPGDTPLVTADEIAQVASSLQAKDSITIVSNREGTGSNCIGSILPLPIPLAFGSNSFVRHCSLIRSSGLQVITLALPGLELDIDTRDDLYALRARPTRCATQNLLKTSGFSNALGSNSGTRTRVAKPGMARAMMR